MAGPIFSEKTLIPVSLLGVVVAGSVWLTSIWRQGEATAAQLEEYKIASEVKEERIYRELLRINDKLDSLVERFGK